MESIAIEECTNAIITVYQNNAIMLVILVISYLINKMILNIPEGKLDYNKLSDKQIEKLIVLHDTKVKELERIKSEKIKENESGNT